MQQGKELLQKIFDTECNPKDLDHRQLKLAFIELLSQFNTLQNEKCELEQIASELKYIVDLKNDELWDLEENQCELKRILNQKQRINEVTERKLKDLEETLQRTEEIVRHREELIEAAGLVLYADASLGSQFEGNTKSVISECILSKQTQEIFNELVGDSIDEKLKFLLENRDSLEQSISKLNNQIRELQITNETKSYSGDCEIQSNRFKNSTTKNVSNREMNDLKMKCQQQSDEIAYLRTEKLRLENAVSKHKDTIGDLEKAEELLKKEKRQYKRELRDANAKVEELTNSTELLQKRIEKVARNKELLTSNLRSSLPTRK